MNPSPLPPPPPDQASTAAHIGLAAVMAAASGALLWALSPLLATLFAASLVLVTFVCPW